jgi:membrane-associated protein
MKYLKFFRYNVFGGAGWVLSMTLIGYFLGNSIPNIDKHIEKVIVVVVFLSILPGIIKYLKHLHNKRTKKVVTEENI